VRYKPPGTEAINPTARYSFQSDGYCAIFFQWPLHGTGHPFRVSHGGLNQERGLGSDAFWLEEPIDAIAARYLGSRAGTAGARFEQNASSVQPKVAAIEAGVLQSVNKIVFKKQRVWSPVSM
jgi:hypothetical protein